MLYTKLNLSILLRNLMSSQCRQFVVGPTTTEKKVGYIGLGTMGAAMVDILLSKGYSVIGYNRTKEKAAHLIEKGMDWQDTPMDVASSADIVLVCVADDNASNAVFGSNTSKGILSANLLGKVIIDLSTVGISHSISMAAQIRKQGGDMIDCPISGSSISLQQNKAITMVGGRKETFDRVKPILLDLGPISTYIGPNGQALALKIAHNLQLAVQMQGFAEAVILAEKAGVKREVAIDVFTHSAVSSPMLQYRGPLLLGDINEVYFSVSMMKKDLKLALDMGQDLRVPLPSVSLCNEYLTASAAMGFSDKDFACVYKTLSVMSGRDPKA